MKPEEIECILSDIIRREGGFIDHPADHGGPTKFGITAKTLGEWRKLKRPATKEEVAALSEEEARAIYRQKYFLELGFAQIDEPNLLHLLLDCAVHSGPKNAVKWLQQALGVPADGKLGPKTCEALKKAEKTALYRKVLAARLRHLGRLIAKDPKQAVFASGWMERIAEFIEGIT